MSKILFVGLDVHAETIAVAVAETGGEVRSMGVIPNRLESVRKLVHKLGPVEHLRACYEAGPTGYVLYWQLTQLGVACEVIAPSLVPTKAGDRVKTDRRDAEKLARCYRAGELTAVWVLDAAHEALRDLVRAREAAKKDQLKARHRLGKFPQRASDASTAHSLLVRRYRGTAAALGSGRCWSGTWRFLRFRPVLSGHTERSWRGALLPRPGLHFREGAPNSFRGRSPEIRMTRPSAGPALLLLLTRLGGIVLLGEQLEAHRLRAFVFNFEIARHCSRADVEGMHLARSPIS
jgi:hypothetical protein